MNLSEHPVNQLLRDALVAFHEAGGDTSTMVHRVEQDGQVYRLVLEGRARVQTPEERLAARVVEIEPGSEEQGDCVFCGGQARWEVNDVPGLPCNFYGQAHDIDCLWVDAHQILNRPLPRGHSAKVELG